MYHLAHVVKPWVVTHRWMNLVATSSDFSFASRNSFIFNISVLLVVFGSVVGLSHIGCRLEDERYKNKVEGWHLQLASLCRKVLLAYLMSWVAGFIMVNSLNFAATRQIIIISSQLLKGSARRRSTGPIFGQSLPARWMSSPVTVRSKRRTPFWRFLHRCASPARCGYLNSGKNSPRPQPGRPP